MGSRLIFLHLWVVTDDVYRISLSDWTLFSAMHGSLVTSSLIRETTENESTNYGYKFGQEEETYNIVASLASIMVRRLDALSRRSAAI
jgi:hypothetical protein